jgi:hypothetical protein
MTLSENRAAPTEPDWAIPERWLAEGLTLESVRSRPQWWRRMLPLTPVEPAAQESWFVVVSCAPWA